MKRKLFLATGLLAATITQAQVGIGTIIPNASAALDIVSTSRGMLIPRMTQAQRTAIATPAEGLLVYQLDAPIGLWMVISGVWTRFTSTFEALGPSSGFADNTAGTSISVLLGGTLVPLPNDQNLGSGVTVNGANTVFTVANAGRYRIKYNVNLTAGLILGSRLLINGSANTASTVAPLLSLSNYQAEIITNLTAGSTVSVQLYGLIATAVLSSGQGASLLIQRVE
jgi:BclA-like protein